MVYHKDKFVFTQPLVYSTSLVARRENVIVGKAIFQN